MAKAIKFNMIIDKKQIRDIDDLLENFNIHDILQNFNDGILERWLRVRSLNSEIAELQSVKGKDDIEKARRICTVFNKELSKDQIEEAVCTLSYNKRMQDDYKKFNEIKFKHDKVIIKYHENYEDLCNEIGKRPEDFGFLKSSVNILWERYFRLLSMDFVRFQNEFMKSSPLILYLILGNKNFRGSSIIEDNFLKNCFRVIKTINRNRSLDKKTYKPCSESKKASGSTGREPRMVTEETVKILNTSPDVKIGESYTGMKSGKDVINEVFNGLYYKSLSSSGYVQYVNVMLDEKTNLDNGFRKINERFLQFPYQNYAGHTQEYWKDIEPKDKRCMILYMEDGNFVRGAGKSGEELGSTDVNAKFPILDGIDYKSNNSEHKLIYLEV